MIRSLAVALLLPAALVFTPRIFAADTLQMIVDDAWSGSSGCHFSGRLTEVRARPAGNQTRLKNLYRNSRQLLTGGEEGPVSWRVRDLTWTTRADDSGYWSLATNQPLPLAPGWHEIATEPAASSPAGLLVLDPVNPLGLISDVDDTIMVSDVLKKTVLLKNSLAVAPEKRVAVPGVAALYHRLLQRNPAPASAAVFYVSASPKQLTDNLRAFLARNGFPRGVLRLKEISETSGESLVGSDQQGYKLRALETVFLACPKTRFILFGDDGEQDPEIYAALRSRFPAQIEGVWIRRVNPDPLRARFPAQADLAELLAPADSSPSP